MSKKLTKSEAGSLLQKLALRFTENPARHPGNKWKQIQAALEADSSKLWAINEMEATGGMPDVVGYDLKTYEYIFFDC